MSSPAQHHHRSRSLESTFCGWILRARRRSDRDNVTPISLSLSLSGQRRRFEGMEEEDGWMDGKKEGEGEERECGAHTHTRNVKLSWLNTGQIYRTIDAFGPLQPAVVDISLRHWSVKRRATRITPRGTSLIIVRSEWKIEVWSVISSSQCFSCVSLSFSLSLEKKKNKKNKNQLQWCFETKAVKANPFTGFNDSVKTARLKRALFPSPRPQDRG